MRMLRKALCFLLVLSVLLKSAAGLAMQVNMAAAMLPSAKDSSQITLLVDHTEHTLHAAMPCHSEYGATVQHSLWQHLVQATHSQCDGNCPSLFYDVQTAPEYAFAVLVHTAPVSKPISIIVAPASPPIKPPLI